MGLMNKIIQYNSLSVKFKDSQFDKLQSAAKSATRGTLKLSSDMTSNGETDFLRKLLSRDWQVTCFCWIFSKNLPAD